MLNRIMVLGSIAGAAMLMGGAATSVAQSQEQTQDQAQQQIFGSQLMTPEERAEYRAKLRAANTMQERERIRTEHHQQMLERARERGMTLPDAPPPASGRGSGGGAGRGMGPARNP